MNYENYPYDIFNPMYLKNTYVQQLENWRNVEQQKNICDMVKGSSRLSTNGNRCLYDGNCATDVDRQTG